MVQDNRVMRLTIKCGNLNLRLEAEAQTDDGKGNGSLVYDFEDYEAELTFEPADIAKAVVLVNSALDETSPINFNF